MTNNKSFVVLLGLTLLVATLATQESYAANMCPVGGPIPACAANIVPGCVGYRNGTFAYVSNGNRCTYCYGLDQNVISFNENQRCPSFASPTPTPTPTPNVPSTFTPNMCPVGGPIPACAANIVPGCAGYKNGTYKYLTNGNRCFHCYSGFNDIVSFNEYQNCPLIASPAPTPNPNIPTSFTPNKCPVGGPIPACAANIVPGCAGYKNGTYKYLTNGNRCFHCYSGFNDVVSFNENQRCPALSSPTPAPEPTSFTPNKCPVGGPAVACAANIVPGCVGYKNGTFKYVSNGNRCTYCYGLDKNVVSFNENQKCPSTTTLSTGKGSSGVKLGLKFRYQSGVLHY